MSTEEGGREKTAPQPAEGIQRRPSRESRPLCVGAELFPGRDPQLRLGRFTPAGRCAARGRREAAIMAAGPARLREPRAAAVERAAGPAALPLRSQPPPSAAAAEAFPGRLHTLPTPHLWGRAHQHGEGAHPRGGG